MIMIWINKNQWMIAMRMKRLTKLHNMTLVRLSVQTPNLNLVEFRMRNLD